MSRHDPVVRMRHMLDNANIAVGLAGRHSRADLDTNVEFRFALTHAVELIGEAASKVPAQTRGEYPMIPWRDIVGMRNRLIHGYDYVDKDLLWDVVSDLLQPLIATLEAILPPLPEK